MGIPDVLARVTERILDYYAKKRELNNQDILTFGSRIAIRSSDGNYVQTDLDNNAKLLARVRHVKEWEIFIIVDSQNPFSYAPNRTIRYGDKVAFKALNNHNFVGVDYDNNRVLMASVPWVKGWETFTILPLPENKSDIADKPIRYGNFFALQAARGEYVMHDRGGESVLAAVASHIREWETFIAIEPSRPQ
jgi:hypothetical protein